MNVTEIKQAIIDKGLSEEQLRGIDAAAIRKRFSDERMSGVFIEKVLQHIKMHADTLQDKANLLTVKTAVNVQALRSSFPEIEFDKYRRDGKRFILIGLDGLIKEDK
ncbi:MAG: hypothetical protein JXA04_01295 [Gammaproteobacteria bacterium]|nr:hypothetical protein [Gammaproteobacteria bacterium]